MNKYNKLFSLIIKLLEIGIISFKDLNKEIKNILFFKKEKIINDLNLVSREEFQIQKNLLNKLELDYKKIKNIR